MKNYFLFILKSKLNLKIKGNNIERIIKRLKNNNIEILNIKYIIIIYNNLLIEKSVHYEYYINFIHSFERFYDNFSY